MKTMGVLIYPGFELLDVFGPLEMFGSLPDKFKIIMVAEKQGRIPSRQGVSVYAETDLDHAPHFDVLFVPGGLGSRQEVNNSKLLAWIKQRSSQASLTLAVCTGSALLAKSGVLDNRNATSNKKAFDWVMQQGPAVHWVRQARWVDDGNIVTSSGVAAGIDMSLHVIARLYGTETSQQVADDAEYIWNKDPSQDQFAKLFQAENKMVSK